MARPIRVEFPGAVYHLMARGNERRAVFRDDQDQRQLVKTVAEMVEQFDLRVHAYCLMPDHYHLKDRRGLCVGVDREPLGTVERRPGAGQ